MSDDFTHDTSTTGSVAVGGTVTGEIEARNDIDWFAVELVAGRHYVIDLKGADSGGGTLDSTVLRGLYDADGNHIVGSHSNFGGDGEDARLTFTATESGKYFIAARGSAGATTGTYTVRVTESTFSDGERAGAKDLGDITDLRGARFPNTTLDGDGDTADYFRFTLSEAKEVELGLRQQDADADLFLEDAQGTVLASSTESGTANERIVQTLLAGTYYIRVEAQEAGANQFKLRYGVSDADAAAVAALEAERQTEQQGEQQAPVNQAPEFGQPSYAFDLAELADGSDTPVALGTVSASDPEDATLIYSIESGNDAGLFEIDQSTGALTYTGAGEDHESGTTSYPLTVRASDGTHTTDVTVTVNVTDVPEAPAFGKASYAFILADSADGSVTAVALGTVSATDPEGDTLTYSIESGNDDELFAIDESTGALSYQGAIDDHESGTTSYPLTVRVSDGTHTTDVAVAVNLTIDPHGQPLTALNLGNITNWAPMNLPDGSLNGVGDRVDYYKFTLDEAKTVALDLRRQDADADLFLENEWGVVLHRSENDGRANESISATLLAGTYYVRLEAQEAGANVHQVRVGVSAPDADEVARLEAAGPQIPLSGTATYTTGPVEVESVPPELPVSLPQMTTPPATAIDVDTRTRGDITGRSERDWYELQLEQGKTYGIFVDAYRWDNRLGVQDGHKLLAPDADIHGADRSLIDGTPKTHPGIRMTFSVEFSPDTTGTHYVVVSGLPTNEGTGAYWLTVFEDDAAAHTGTNGRAGVDRVVAGEIEYPEDRDWFAVELEADTEYQIDLKGASSDHGTLINTRIAGIYDSDGRYVSGTSDSHSGRLFNSRVTFTPDTAGTYYISADANGDHTGTYALQVKESGDDFVAGFSTEGEVAVTWTNWNSGYTTPPASGSIDYDGDQDWFAVELEADSRYEIFLRGGTLAQASRRIDGIYDSDGELIDGTSGARVAFTATESGTYYIAAGAEGASTGTYKLVVDPDQFSADTSTTGTVAVGGSVDGIIDYTHDRDWIAVELVGGTTYQVDLKGRPLYGPYGGDPRVLDPYLHGIHDSEGNLIDGTTDDDSGNSRNARVEFTPEDSGTYYIAAGSDFLWTGGYTLEVVEAM